jgi:hypothetical protein
MLIVVAGRTTAWQGNVCPSQVCFLNNFIKVALFSSEFLLGE